MAVPVHVPRINNNDDEVKLVECHVDIGAAVTAGQVIASVETDKAVVDVEAPSAGFLLGWQGEVDAMVTVGSVLAWLGSTADEAMPQRAAAEANSRQATGTPTAKAQALLREHGLQAADVAASGDRLSAQDVLQHVVRQGIAPRQPGRSTAATVLAAALPTQPGQRRALQSHERGMLQTVTWQREVAVPGYIELAYDHAAWEQRAAAVGAQHKLLLNPLLPMLAWRLVTLAEENPCINATLAGDERHEYDQVNLGFTVQAGDVLYLAVVRNAAALGELGFINALIDVQRRAAAHALKPAELQGATISFSSMSRWKVSRHMPILAPMTAVMIGHTVDAQGAGVLGATYDHRVIHGGDIATLLRKLGNPPKSP